MSLCDVGLSFIALLLGFIALTDVLPLATVAVTHWKLQDTDLVVAVDSHLKGLKASDPVFAVLVDSLQQPDETTGVVNRHSDSNEVAAFAGQTTRIFMDSDKGSEFDGKFRPLPSKTLASNDSVPSLNALQVPAPEQVSLSCGKFANTTWVDHLESIKKRAHHGYYREPELEVLFTRKVTEPPNFESIEQSFIQAVKEQENTPVLFNLVGNFLRIHGNTYYALECYRNVLEHSPDSIDAILNLARMMLNLNYPEDALEIVKRSLENKGQSTWLLRFMLGQVYVRLGNSEKAIESMEIAYEKNPSFEPARQQLSSLKGSYTSKTSGIVFLVVLVIFSAFFLIFHYCIRSDPDYDWKEKLLQWLTSSKTSNEVL